MIEAPTNCPSCDHTLEWSNDQLYCRNSECGSTLQKKVEHFASTMKIKGLGPSTIAKLNLSSILDIYLLSGDEVEEAIGSEKVAVKLMEEIEISKTKSLNVVLPAFGIPLIGKTATDKLSKVCSDIEDIDEETCKLAGLGEKATSNLLNWLEQNDFYLFLPFDLKFDKQTAVTNDSTRGVICISGKLNSYSTKQQAQLELEQLGFIVKSTLTKDVTILVNESGKETSKTQKARESGVQIVTNLIEFIGDIN